MRLASQFTGMVVVTVLWVLALIPAGIAAMMSPMMFDAGESGLAWTMFSFVALFPVLILIGVAMAWVAYGFERTRLAWACMAAPLVWLALGAGAYALLGGK